MVSVINLKRAQESTLQVTAVKFGYQEKSATFKGSSLTPPLNLIPSIGPLKPDGKSFTVQVTNFDDYFDWAVSTSSGSALISNKGLISVTGFDPNKVVSVVVTDSHNAATVGQLTFQGYANPSALVLVPKVGIKESLLNGFTFQILNYDPIFTWKIMTDRGRASIDASGLASVTDLNVGDTPSINVFTRIGGMTNPSVNLQGSTYPLLGYIPTFSEPVGTDDGFTTTIANYNSFYEYVYQSDVGTTQINNQGEILVTGLYPGASAVITVQTRKKNQTLQEAQVIGTASLSANLNISPPKTLTCYKKASDMPVIFTSANCPSGYTQTKPKKVTISCYKGKTVKKVTSFSPKCPAGYYCPYYASSTKI